MTSSRAEIEDSEIETRDSTCRVKGEVRPLLILKTRRQCYKYIKPQSRDSDGIKPQSRAERGSNDANNQNAVHQKVWAHKLCPYSKRYYKGFSCPRSAYTVP